MVPIFPKTALAAVIATLSFSAKAISFKGSTYKYIKLALIYIKVTILVPKNKLSPILRCGFLISPAMKVTLFQESLLKIEPTIAAAISPIKAVPCTGTQLLETTPSTLVVAIFCLAAKALVQFISQ